MKYYVYTLDLCSSKMMVCLIDKPNSMYNAVRKQYPEATRVSKRTFRSLSEAKKHLNGVLLEIDHLYIKDGIYHKNSKYLNKVSNNY